MKRLKLKWLIIIPFILQVGGAIALSGVLAYRQGLTGIEEQAKKLLKSSSLNITTQLENYLFTPELVTETNSQAIDLGTLNTLKLRDWVPYLIKQSQLFPELNFIYYGDEQGYYVHIKRHHPQPYLEVVYKGITTQDQFIQETYDLSGNLVPTPQFIADSLDQSYDPRPRPWFKKALSDQKATWTESYRFIDIKPNFGISHVQPILRPQNQNRTGVLGADFSLLGINLFLEQLAIGPSGKAFIIENTQAGNLIASSAPYPEINNRPTVWDIDDSIIQETATYLFSQYSSFQSIDKGQSLNFKGDDGHQYLISVEPYQNHMGINWLIVVAIPESDLTPPLQKQNLYLTIICIVAWLITLLLGWITASIIAKALRKIRVGTLEVAQGNLQLKLEGEKLEEINTLAQSFNFMSEKLVIAKQSSEQVQQNLQKTVQLTEQELQSACQSWQNFEKNFRATFFYSPIPMVIIAIKTGEVLEVNQAFLESSQFTKSSVLGKDANGLGSWPNATKQRKVRATLIRNQQLPATEMEWVNPLGELKHIVLSGQVIEFQRERCVLMTAKDMTEEKKTELSLIAAKQSAQKANRSKSEFLANMSHELRTPLNAILGFSQLLSRGSVATQQHREYLNIIMRSGGHLLNLINDVLDMSKIEAGQTTLNPETLNLIHFLKSIKETLSLKASKKGIQLIVDWDADIPNFIVCDKGKLRQVLLNILDNAIKFTSSGSVEFQVHHRDVQQQTNPDIAMGNLYFSIQDSGVGIAEDEIKNLFNPFVQTSSGKTLQEGTGLGLAISQRFIRLLGGELKVESNEGQGSHFYFDLDVVIPENPVSNTANPKTVIGIKETSPSPKMLIIDDHLDSARLLKELLMSTGFESKTAVNATLGLELVQSWKPQLVWMDLKLPDIDGLTATEEIKRFAAPPIVIALTAQAFSDETSQRVSQAFDDFVRKPFQDQEIFSTIQQFFDVEYIYREDLAIDSEPQNIPEINLNLMPRDWIQQLYKASSRLDSQKILNLILEIPEPHQTLKEKLTALHSKFRFDSILELTQQYLENN